MPLSDSEKVPSRAEPRTRRVSRHLRQPRPRIAFSSSRVLAYDELFAKRCCFLFFKMEDGRPQTDERAQAGRALAAAPDGRASAQEQRNVDDALGYR